MAASVEAATVSPTISVVPSPSPAASGQPVTVSVTVTGVGNLPAPTGTVQLQVNGITYGGSSIQLSASGTATFSIPGAGVPQPGTILFVGPGACTVGSPSPNTVGVEYSGDMNYSPATATACLTVVPALTISPNPAVYGQPVTYTATVDSLLTGAVTFFDGATSVHTSAPISSGQVSFAPPLPLSVGTHTITASFVGQVSSPTQLQINKANTTTNLSFGQNGALVTLAATVTPVPPGAGTPTGTVQFMNGGNVLGSPQLTNSTAIVSATGISGTVTAVYSGDTNFAGSTGGTTIGPVQPPPPVTNTVSVSISTSLNPSNLGQPVTFSAGVSVASGSGIPTGNVTFLDGSNPIGGGSLSGGSASVTISTLTVGSHAITAQYSGDSAFPGGSATLGQVVNRVASTLSLGVSPVQVNTTQSLTLTAQVGPTPQATIPGPTGQISFSDGGTQLGSASVAGGAASISVSNLTAGAHQFTASYSGDTNYTAASASASVTVTVAPLTITTTSLGNGTVAQTYMASLAVQGGVKPYMWLVGGLPPGLTADTSGNITGIPTDTGTYALTVQVTDSKGSSASSSSLSITVVALPLSIMANLPGGQQGTSYSGTIMVSGGVPPYTVTVSGLPAGLNYSSGSITGQPTYSGSSTITVQATDSKKTSASQQFTINVASTPLTITTASLANGTAGQPYSQPVTAIGGSPPYTWSATLPNDLSIDPNTGIISGTPYVVGPVSITVTVTDTAKGGASSTYTVTFAVPSTIPQLIFTGLEDSEPAQTEPNFGVKWVNTFPADVQGTITLTFQPATGTDSGEVMFANGTRTIKFTIPANTLPGVFTDMPAFQTGTVSGAIALTVDLKAGGIEITPQPPPIYQLEIPAGPPVITNLTASVSGSTLTVATTGYSTTRELTQAVFTFNPVAGASLQTTTLTVPLSSLFAPWFSGNQVIGSQFLYTQQFDLQGNTQAVASVTVTLANTQGNSQAITANVP